ncbi:MAG TPA: hypothetical protein VE007_06695 [Thermoanaerobaculia bacterium]|nr:hypothetical protein [Thermoanaerobaculia bacterium]
MARSADDHPIDARSASDRLSSAIGLSSHSGWAALVAFSGPAPDPVLLLRVRLVLADPEDISAKQPFHAAEGMPFAKAKTFIGAAIADARLRARRELGTALRDLRNRGWDPARCAVLLASGRPLPALESVLASHALIHAAEGDHFRDALADAAKHHGLEVVRVARKELAQRASVALRAPAERLAARLVMIGKSAGPPWGQDQKLAALAAWMCLGRVGSR